MNNTQEYNSSDTQTTNWKYQKRRIQFQFRSNFGKESITPDEVYEQHEQRFLCLLDKLHDIRKSLEYYQKVALPMYCSACTSLGADIWSIVSADNVGKGTDPEKFRHAMCTINETKGVKSHYFSADAVLAGAVRFLDIHINAMNSVKSQMHSRKQAKLEFDCYDFKVRKLRESKDENSKRLHRNITKFTASRDKLVAVTLDLYRTFAKYESERDTMLNGELEMVRQVMHGFYSKNALATDFHVAEERDHELTKLKATQIYQQMEEQELEYNETARSIDLCNSNYIINKSTSASTSSSSLQVSMSELSSNTHSDTDMRGTQGLSLCNLETELDISTQQDAFQMKLKTIQLSRPKVPQLNRVIGWKRCENNNATIHDSEQS